MLCWETKNDTWDLLYNATINYVKRTSTTKTFVRLSLFNFQYRCGIQSYRSIIFFNDPLLNLLHDMRYSLIFIAGRLINKLAASTVPNALPLPIFHYPCLSPGDVKIKWKRSISERLSRFIEFGVWILTTWLNSCTLAKIRDRHCRSASRWNTKWQNWQWDHVGFYQINRMLLSFLCSLSHVNLNLIIYKNFHAEIIQDYINLVRKPDLFLLSIYFFYCLSKTLLTILFVH